MRIQQDTDGRPAGRIRAALDLALSLFGACAVATVGFPHQADAVATAGTRLAGAR
jgi:hypothetical protein